MYLVLLSQQGLKLSMVEMSHSLERAGNGISSYESCASELALGAVARRHGVLCSGKPLFYPRVRVQGLKKLVVQLKGCRTRSYASAGIQVEFEFSFFTYIFANYSILSSSVSRKPG